MLSLWKFLEEIEISKINIPCIETIIYLLVIAVIIAVLVTTASCYLQYYEIKISKENGEKDKQKLNKREKRMYYSNVLLLILITFVIYIYKNILALIPIFILGFSIITRVMKKKKISNILCWLIVIPTLISPVFIAPIIFNYNTVCVGMEDVEKTSFNTKFVQYESDKATGTQVKSLIQQIMASNANPEDEDRKITLNLNGKQENDMIEASSKIIRNYRYKIYFEYNNDGYINKTIIEENPESNSLNTTK